MTDDHGPREHFSDDEMAFLRHAEFGELPERIRPEQRLELTETESRREPPEPPPWVPQG